MKVPTYRPPDADLIKIENIPPSTEVRAELAGRTVLLAFSRGKDSIAAWLAMLEAGVTVLPFYRYSEPHVSFVNENLAYFEQLFQTPILRIPHVSMARLLANYVHQPPERTQLIAAMNLPTPDYRAVNDLVCEHYGVDPATTWIADGVRASDSPDRRRSLAMHGPFNHNEMQVRVVWDWRVKHTWEAMAAAGVAKPVDYQIWPRSYDGIQYDFIEGVRQRFPEDYARILGWFPMASVDHFRRHHLSRSHKKLGRRKDATDF